MSIGHECENRTGKSELYINARIGHKWESNMNIWIGH